MRTKEHQTLNLERKARKGMGNMKRKIMAMALAASMAATMLVGCGGSGGNVETNAPKATDGQQESSGGGGDTPGGSSVEGYEKYQKRTDLTTDDVQLTVWESADGPDQFIEDAGRAFTEIYPNITIKYVNVESTNAKDQIANDGPAGIGPDLFAVANDTTGTMAAAGSIQPIDDIDASFVQSVKDCTEPICQQGVTYDGKMWGFPVARETYTIFYNKDLLKDYIEDGKFPTTWEELIEVCKKWNGDHSGKYALMWQVGNTYHNVAFLTSDKIKLFGETYQDYSNGTGFGNETSIAGAKFFQSLKSSILDVSADSLDEATTVAAFENGDCAMIIDGSWKISAFENSIQNLGAALLPSLPGQSQPMANFAGIRTMYVSNYSEHAKEAAAFGEFLMCKEMQQMRYEVTKTIPATDSITVDDEIMKVFMEQSKYSFPMSPIPQINQYWTAYNAVYKNIWNGEDAEKQITDAENIFKTFTQAN